MKLGLQSGTQEQIQQVADIVAEVVTELEAEKISMTDRFDLNLQVVDKPPCQVCKPIKSCAEDGSICDECFKWLQEDSNG